MIFKVVDNNGRLSGGQIRILSPDGRMAVMETDGAGTAEVNLKLGTWAGAGNNRVEVSSLGVKERVMFAASGTAGAVAFVHVGSGGDQRGAVNHLLPEPLVATVTDAGHNPVDGVAVTFRVVKGGGKFTNGEGTVEVSTDSDGRAAVNMILGSEAGNDVHWVEADFAGNGGSPAVFLGTGVVPGNPGETRISGVILDNMNQPVPGVTARVDGTTRQDASDSQGQFVIDNVPIGPVHLIIEGSTATVPGEWPLLSFELTTIAGANNTLGKPIYLLPIDIARAKRVGGSKDVVYTLPEVPGFSLTVKAGSVTFPDGSREGLISVTPVHMDKVPMSPPYGLQSRFMITIQPPGAVFDPPAPLSLPNTEGLERGEKVNLFSFDHDLGAFVSIGPGSVSSDGIRVVSDPGVGVIKAGWHCGANPQPVGMCQSEPPMCGGQLTGCGACEICDTTNCWRLPDCYEACGGARCGSCEDCVDGSCVVETRGNPPCQPLAGSCRDCPVEWDCVTCESNICIFRGCGGPADDDGTCTPACDTCTHCFQGRCYPDDTCEDDSSSCVGTCGDCQVCRSDSCVRDGRCDMDDQESNGNEGDFCSSVLPCRVCLQCENSACAVGDLPACLDNLDVVITPPGPVIMPVGGTRRLTSVGGPLAGTYAWSVSDSSVVGIQGSSTVPSVTIEGLSAGTATATVSFTAGGKTVTDSVEVRVVKPEVTIDVCPYSWLPKGGNEDNSVEIKVRIYPLELKGIIKLRLEGVSDEKGYAVNAPKNVPFEALEEDSDDWKDLQFSPNQVGLNITGTYNQQAETMNEVNSVTIQVNSYDYGSFGQLKANAVFNNGNLVVSAQNAVDGSKEYITIPYDETGNSIADSWEDTNGYGLATEDNDNQPPGNGVNGDGFPRYEEYRGMIVKDIHTRLNPQRKDLFVYVHETIAGFTSLIDPLMILRNASGFEVHDIDPEQFFSEDIRVVNFNRETFEIGQQFGLFLEDDPQNNYQMEFTEGPNGTPLGKTRVVIDVRKICETFGSSDSGSIADPVDLIAIRMLIAHGCFHGSSVWHHNESNPFAGPSCVMRYFDSDRTDTQPIPDNLCTTVEDTCSIGRCNDFYNLYIKDN